MTKSAGKEILNGKLHFLCSAASDLSQKANPMDRGRKLKAHTSELRKQVTIISQKWRKWLYVVQCFHIIQCFHKKKKTGKNESKTKIY